MFTHRFLIIAICLLFFAIPHHPIRAQTNCGNVLNRMTIGGQGRVTVTDGTPTNLRASPTIHAALISSMTEGTQFQVLAGPNCADGYAWWQIQTQAGLQGWVAEGNDNKYFVEPLGYISSPTPQEQIPIISCDTLPSNLWVGATAQVAFRTGQTPLPVFTQPDPNTQTDLVLSEGDDLDVIDGPKCGNGVIWWKIQETNDFRSGWTPEVNDVVRLLLRTTSDPNDHTALYDPFLSSDPRYLIAPHRVLRVYSEPNTSSTVIDAIWPENAYEVIGKSISLSMNQIRVNGRIGWVCVGLPYSSQNHPFDPVPFTTDTNYRCTEADFNYSANDVFGLADTTIYPPGQYPHLSQLQQALNPTPLAEDIAGLSNLAIAVKSIQTDQGSLDIVCFANTALASTASIFPSFPLKSDPLNDIVCVILDSAKIVIRGEGFEGPLFWIAEVIADHEKTIDPYIDQLNTWVDSRPLTTLFCHYWQMTCITGIGQ